MFSFLSNFNRRTLAVLGLLVIAIAIPLTVMLAQKAQELRGRAAQNGAVQIINPGTGQPFPNNQTLTADVLLRLTIPDNWAPPQSRIESNRAQSIVPKAYAAGIQVFGSPGCDGSNSRIRWTWSGGSGYDGVALFDTTTGQSQGFPTNNPNLQEFTSAGLNANHYYQLRVTDTQGNDGVSTSIQALPCGGSNPPAAPTATPTPTSPPPPPPSNDSCPAAGDTCIYSEVDANGQTRCYSGTGASGFNAPGCEYSCGPVNCPGGNPPPPTGGTRLFQLYIKNDDGGSGGHEPVTIQDNPATAQNELLQYISGPFFWKLNTSGPNPKKVTVNFYDRTAVEQPGSGNEKSAFKEITLTTTTEPPAPPPGGGGGAPEGSVCERISIDGQAWGPETVVAPGNHEVVITMKNPETINGATSTIWQPGYKLVPLDSATSSWQPQPSQIPAGRAVAPRNTETFEFTVTAPNTTPASISSDSQIGNFNWILNNGTSNFGAACSPLLATDAAGIPPAVPPAAGSTTVTLQVALQEYQAIQAGTGQRSARSPVSRSTRSMEVILKNIATNQVSRTTTNFTWQGGFYRGTMTLGANSIAAGTNNYKILVKERNHLRRTVASSVPITAGIANPLIDATANHLLTADANGDNKVDVLDHSIIVQCLDENTRRGLTTCTGTGSQDADFDDSGGRDIFDYNWFIENFSLCTGATKSSDNLSCNGERDE